jgi:hypothetical protein
MCYVHDLNALVWLKLKTLEIAQWGSAFCLLIEIGGNNARVMLSRNLFGNATSCVIVTWIVGIE